MKEDGDGGKCSRGYHYCPNNPKCDCDINGGCECDQSCAANGGHALDGLTGTALLPEEGYRADLGCSYSVDVAFGSKMCDGQPELSCGVGTKREGDECVGIATTCHALWAGKDKEPHYVPNHECQCNGLCLRYGNCCMDAPILKETENTCAALGSPKFYVRTNPCQCNKPLCEYHGNCCVDA